MEKQLPHNLEAEMGALGSLIIDPEALSQVADRLQADDFYRDAHRTIYRVIKDLSEKKGQPADYITICDTLEREQLLEEVGGPASISSLINEVPTSGNLQAYAQIVMQKALLRRLIHTAGQIAASAYEEADNALEQAEQLIFALGQRGRASDFTPIGPILSACMEDLSAVHEQPGSIQAVPTGFVDLDVVLGGLQPSDLVILAGRPGTGKTSFALSLAANAIYRAGKHVAFFSLEMSSTQLGVRLLAMESRIDQKRLRMGWIHDEEWEGLVKTLDTLSPGPLWIDETAALTVSALRSKARRLQAQHGIDLVIVDYVQLMQSGQDGKRTATREQEIAEISRGLKAIAKELNVPVLALAQLSRAVEARASKIPQLSDLRESGALENDADVVLFVYRDELYNPQTDSPNTADIIVAKHRNGPIGSIRLAFDATQTRFSTNEVLAPEEE